MNGLNCAQREWKYPWKVPRQIAFANDFCHNNHWSVRYAYASHFYCDAFATWECGKKTNRKITLLFTFLATVVPTSENNFLNILQTRSVSSASKYQRNYENCGRLPLTIRKCYTSFKPLFFPSVTSTTLSGTMFENTLDITYAKSDIRKGTIFRQM